MALNRNDSFNPNDISWMDSGADPSERSALSKAMRFIFGAGKGFVSGTVEGEYERLAEKNFKNVDDANREISDITAAASDALSDFNKTFGEFKSAAKQLGLSYTEGLSSVLPGGIYRRLSRAFEEPETETRSASDDFEDRLQNNLSSVFSAQSRISSMQHSASMKSAAADRALGAKYHQQNVGLMAASNRSVAHIDAFLSTTYTNYLKKDLELKYRSYRIMGQLKTKVNTISEAFGKEGMMTSIANALIPNPDADRGTRKTNTIADYTKNIYKNIFENLLQIPSNLLQTGATIMSALAQSPIEGIQGVAGLAGKWGGNKLLKHIKENYLSKKNQKRVDKWKGVLDDVMAAMSSDWEYFARNKSGVLNSLGQTLRGSDSSVLRFLGDAIPEFGRDNRVENKVVNDPKGAAVFDNITRETIISVIPTHLSRIGDQLEAFAKSQGITPNKTTTKVYDFRTRNLVTREERRRRNVDAIYGKAEDRQERYYSTINTFMNLSQYIDDNNQQVEALSSIEENKQGLHLFIMRSARANLLVNETALLKVAKGTMLTGSEEDYVKATLGSISSAEAKNTARAILLLITRRDAHGKPHGVDHNLKRLINNKISEMSRDVDQNDMTRTQLEDMNMFDEEDYTYDELSGESNVNERARTTQWSKDYVGTNEMGFNAGVADENIIKDRARYQKWLDKIKDKHSRGTAAKWARRLNSNFAVFMGGRFLDEVDDWAQLAEEGLNDLGESVGSSKIMGWLNKKAGGKKNKVTRIVAYRDPKDTKPEDDVKAHVIFRVGGLTATSKYRSSFSFMLDDLKYTVGDVVMARMASDTQPSRELKPIVDEIINKLGRDKYEPEYSAEFFRYSTGEDESALDYDVEPPSGPGPAKAGGPGGQPPPGGGGFSQMWKNLADRTRSRISDFMTNSNLEGASGTKNYLDKIDRHSAQEYLASIDRNLVYLAKHFLPPEDSRSITSVLGRIAKADKIKRAAAEAEALHKASAEGSADRASKYQQVRMEDLKKRAKELVQRINSGTSSPMQQKIDQETLNNILSEFRLRGLRGAELEKYTPQRLTSSGKAFIMKDEDRYSSDAMTDEELKSARRWFENKTKYAEQHDNPAVARDLAERTIEFENAVKAGDWLTARQLSDQQYGQLQNYQYTTAMTKKEIKEGTSVFAKRVDEEYKAALTDKQIERLRSRYKKRADKGDEKAIERLVAFDKLVADKDWKTIRETHRINKELDNYQKYKQAVEEERWEDARRMTGVLATKQSDDIGLYNQILTLWTKTVTKNGEMVKAYPFDEEHSGYIAITLNNALAMLRNIEPGHKEVTKALTRILEAFGNRKTSTATRTKNMLEVLDDIASDKTLYKLRNGEEYIGKVAEYDSGISVDDESLMDKIEAETPTTENPLFKEIKEQYEAYKKAGIDLPDVGTILNNLEGVKSSGEVNKVLRKIRDVYISLGETDIEITHPDNSTAKIKFGEYMEKLDNVKVIIDENAFGKKAADRLYPEMLRRATGHVTGFMEQGKSRSKKSILEKLKADTQKFADQKAAEAAKKAEEQGKQGIIDNIFGFFRRNKETGETPKEGEDTTTTSSSYADGSYRWLSNIATMHAEPGVEVTNLQPNRKKNMENTSFFGRMFSMFSPLLKRFKQISNVDDSPTIFRVATRAGLSTDTAAVLSFMNTIGRKIDQNTLGAAAGSGRAGNGVYNYLDKTISGLFTKGAKKVKEWTAAGIKALLKKVGPITTFDIGGLLGQGVNLGRKGIQWILSKLLGPGAAAGGAKGIAGLLNAGSTNGAIDLVMMADGSYAMPGVARAALPVSGRIPLLNAAPPSGTVFGEGFSATPGFNAPAVRGGSNLAIYRAPKTPFNWGSIFNLRNLAIGGGGLAGGLMGGLGSKSSGAGNLSQFVSGTAGGVAGGAITSALMGGGAAGLASMGPVGWTALALLAGNAMREGWNDNKSLAKTWGSTFGLTDYQKGSSAFGNLLNYLTFGLLNKTGARKYIDKTAMYTGVGHMTGAAGGLLGGWGDIIKSTGVSDDGDAMSDEELKQARARLQTNIKRGVPDAEEKLQQFEEAVQDKNWYRARDISGLHIDNANQLKRGAKRVLKNSLAFSTLGLSSVMEWGYDTLVGNNDKPMSKSEVARALKNFAVLEKKDPSYKAKRLDFEEAIAGERWAIARKLSGLDDQGWLGKKFGKTGGALALTGLAPLVWLFDNNENEPMSEKEIRDFTVKCQKLIRQGNQTAALLLDRFETAVAKSDWALARKLAGKETQSLFTKGAKIFSTISRYTPGIGLFFWDSSSAMSKEEIHNFRKKMEYRISKGDPQAQRQLEKFETAIIRNDWETARRISKIEAHSVFYTGTKWTLDILFGSQSKPMTDAEIKRFRDSMQRKIDMGDTGAKVILEKFDDAVGNQKWDIARKISNTRNVGLLEKYVNLHKTVAKWMFDPLGILRLPQSDRPMSEKEVSSVRSRLQKLIDTNGSSEAKNLLDQFNDAVADGNWAKARRISGMKDSGGWITSITKNIMLGSTDRYQEDEKDRAAGSHAERYRMIADRVKEAISKKESEANKSNSRKALESLIGLRSLQKDMRATDVLELDDELLDKWEAKLRQFDNSVGLMEAEDISEYESTRKEKIKLIEQKNALLSEITAAQERCGFFEWSKRSALKQLFTEVNDLTIDELDQDLINGYDEDLRAIDSKAITTKNLSEAERKRMTEVNKRKNALLGNIERAISGTSFYRLPTLLSLKRLRNEVESALPEELTDEMFESWDMDLKELDPTAHDSKQRSQEELLAIKEMNRKRLVLINAIKKSIDNCSFYELFKKNNLNALLKEVESTPDEDITAELLQEWELDLKDLDENALGIEEEDAEEKAHKQLLRDKRKLRVKLRVTSKQYKRKKDTSTAKALQKIVDTLDSIDDDEFTREEYKDALEDFVEIDKEASADLSKAEADRQEAEKQQNANLSSGKNEQAISLDKNGRIVDMQEGSPTSVSLKTKPGGQIIHTHPDGSPTSATDIVSAIMNGQTSVTTLKSGKVLGYSGQTLPDILKETVNIQQKQAQQNTAEMHSVLKDIMTGVTDSVSSLDTRDVLTNIYDRLGDVIETIAEHNGVVNNKIVASATQSYDLARNFTLSKMKQKVSSISSVFRPSVISIGK